MFQRFGPSKRGTAIDRPRMFAPSPVNQEGSPVETEMWQGNIARADVDVILTTANHALVGGGGMDGAVHDAAGTELLPAQGSGRPARQAQAVITPTLPSSRGCALACTLRPRHRLDGPRSEAARRPVPRHPR